MIPIDLAFCFQNKKAIFLKKKQAEKSAWVFFAKNSNQPSVFLASTKGLETLLNSNESLNPKSFLIKKDQNIPKNLELTLKDLGYQSSFLVETPGSFSFKGASLDIFPAGSPLPFRAELFANTVTDIHSFDIQSQRRLEQVNECLVLPLNFLSTKVTAQKSLDVFSKKPLFLSVYPEKQQNLFFDFNPDIFVYKNFLDSSQKTQKLEKL